MAEFAIISLSTMASRNPRIRFPGTVPHLGSHLTVHWPYLIGLCAGIVGVQFALFISAIYVSRFVFVKDDSNLSTARLLRPLVNLLGPLGTAHEGEEMSTVIQKSLQGGVVYGPRNVEGSSDYVLDIGSNVPVRSTWQGGRHPNGRYL